jgi:hypothetical protein
MLPEPAGKFANPSLAEIRFFADCGHRRCYQRTLQRNMTPEHRVQICTGFAPLRKVWRLGAVFVTGILDRSVDRFSVVYFA